MFTSKRIFLSFLTQNKAFLLNNVSFLIWLLKNVTVFVCIISCSQNLKIVFLHFVIIQNVIFFLNLGNPRETIFNCDKLLLYECDNVVTISRILTKFNHFFSFSKNENATKLDFVLSFIHLLQF